MDDNKKQAVALMRYSAISPAITGAQEPQRLRDQQEDR